MIEKILDKYYTKKLVELIFNDIVIYYIDKRVRYEKDFAIIDIKKRKYSEEYYKELVYISYGESLNTLINYDKIRNSMLNEVERILKED